MSRSAITPFDSSMVRQAKRLVIVCLIGITFLPGILWALSGALRSQETLLSSLIDNPSISTAFITLVSASIALALWIGIFARPMSAMQHAERLLRSAKLRDLLTGLPNRAGLHLALGYSLKHHLDLPTTTGMLLIDVDRFRLLNNAFGHPVGDDLLKRVADRIRTVVRVGDLVARVSGDQFAIKVDGVTGSQGLTVMARNLLRAFESAYPIGDQNTMITLSIGVAIADDTAQTVDAVLDNAETALRVAKQNGGNRFVVYEEGIQRDDIDRLNIEARLRQALGRGEFRLVYQPIMAGDGSHISAIEALLRWDDPERGAIEPEKFIPYLEESGEIIEVGAWVMRTACIEGRKWLRNDATDLRVSVNVSPRQVQEANFLATVESILAETGFPASHLQLEITENLLLDPSPEIFERIDAMNALGVLLVLDDFGIGYSSLTYLKRFPLYGLKIDRIFTRDIPASERDTTIVRAITDLGHGLGMHVTAEGVETREQFDSLRELGCDSLQGYHFSGPVEAEELAEMLKVQEDSIRRLSSPSEHRSGPRPEFAQIVPVKGRVRISRNDEVLVESSQAIRLIQRRAEDWELVLLVPETDIRVALNRTNQSDDQANDEFSAEPALDLDLVGQSGQILHPRIARSYQGATGDGLDLKGKVSFRSEVVTVAELPA